MKLERKSDPALDTLEVKKSIDTFMRGFEEFKATNDKRLDEIAKMKSADPLLEEKLKKISDDMDKHQKSVEALRLERARPVIHDTSGTKRELTDEEIKHKSDFRQYVRKGDVGKTLEEKSLTAGTGPDGGYVVPVEADLAMDRLVSEVSPIRQIAQVRTISSAMYKKPFNVGGATSGWVGETSARPETNTPSLKELQYPAMELYAMPAATQSLLDDAAVNIEEWLASEVQITFAEQEGAAFVAGDGVAKPKGFTAYDMVADASWAWGKIGYFGTGANGAFAAAPNGGDALINTVYGLKAAYRQNARWVMNRLTQSGVRKLKDSDGAYLWQPGIQAGQPASLLSYAITEAEDMADYTTTGADAIYFGDFRRGYLIVDRIGTRVLRDPYSSKPYVLFYTTKRVGGGIQNFEAIKALRFS